MPTSLLPMPLLLHDTAANIIVVAFLVPRYAPTSSLFPSSPPPLLLHPSSSSSSSFRLLPPFFLHPPFLFSFFFFLYKTPIRTGVPYGTPILTGIPVWPYHPNGSDTRNSDLWVWWLYFISSNNFCYLLQNYQILKDFVCLKIHASLQHNISIKVFILHYYLPPIYKDLLRQKKWWVRRGQMPQIIIALNSSVLMQLWYNRYTYSMDCTRLIDYSGWYQHIKQLFTMILLMHWAIAHQAVTTYHDKSSIWDFLSQMIRR